MVVIDEEESQAEGMPQHHYLLGQLLSIRPHNRQALINTMRGLWKPAKDLTVNAMDANCLLFRFQGRGDIDRVLKGRPWCFDKHVLLLEEVDLSAQLRNMVLETNYPILVSLI